MLATLKEKIFGSRRQSKSLAKSRLHFVLVQDRTGLTNDELASFKKEIMCIVEKYFVVDKQGFDIDYQREAGTTTLVINSPVVVRRQDAIKGKVGARKVSRKRKRSKAQAQNA